MGGFSHKNAIIIFILLVSAPQGGQATRDKDQDKGWTWSDIAIAGGAGVAGVVAAPFVLTAAGFTGGGVAAGSLAAKAMSVAWSTQAGIGAVSTLQAAGAAGLTVAQYLGVGAVTGYAGYAAYSAVNNDEESDKK